MYGTIYQIGVWMASKGLGVSGLINRGVRQFIAERKDATRPEPGKVRYWIHCASVGEYEMAAPVILALLAEVPREKILITFFSPSGYRQLRKDPQWSGRIMYLPLDERKVVRQFYRDYQPDHAILVRYELWYNLLREGLRKGCTFHLINARFQKGHFVFSRLGRPYLKLLRKFAHIYTSDEKSAAQLKTEGVEQVSFTGDTRYDRMKQIQEAARTFERIETFKGDRPLLILGSSHFYEENLLLEAMHDMPDIKIVIAPHDVSEERIIQIETLFSSFRPKTWSSPYLGDEDKLLIINNIGILSSLYRYADMALVGGGYTGALHNVIEPLMWGNVVLFGPQHDKFPEANDLIREGLAFTVKDSPELVSLVERWLMQRDVLQAQRDKVEAFVSKRLGASEQIVRSIS